MDRSLRSLTDVEARVSRGVAQGLTNAQIAERLVCSPWTVQTHVKRIFRKLGLQRRAELAVLAALEWDDLEVEARIPERDRTA